MFNSLPDHTLTPRAGLAQARRLKPQEVSSRKPKCPRTRLVALNCSVATTMFWSRWRCKRINQSSLTTLREFGKPAHTWHYERCVAARRVKPDRHRRCPACSASTTRPYRSHKSTRTSPARQSEGEAAKRKTMPLPVRRNHHSNQSLTSAASFVSTVEHEIFGHLKPPRADRVASTPTRTSAGTSQLETAMKKRLEREWGHLGKP